MKKLLAFLTIATILAGCSDESLTPETIEEADFTQGERAYLESGNLVTAYYKGKKVVVENIDGQYVLNGDILVSESQLSFVAPPSGEGLATTESVGRLNGRWPNNVVYYTISSSLPNQSRVTDAIAHWEANTNLTFVQRTSQSNYIEFVSGSGCSSYVGMIGGRQTINLASGCSTGNTIHEIGHAVGLYHEHTRNDRDDYVIVNFQNIQSNRGNNFQKAGSNSDEYTSSLDFGSVMLYSSYAFSSNGQPTITRLDGSTFNVQRQGLSTGDQQGINVMYPGDGGGGPDPEPEYQNGQYYTIDGVRVYRYYDRWWYYTSSNGWREVVNIDGTWYYA